MFDLSRSSDAYQIQLSKPSVVQILRLFGAKPVFEYMFLTVN